VEIELTLDPGTYVIVPRTSGCAMAKPLATRSQRKDLFDQSIQKPRVDFISTIKDVFTKYDLKVSQSLS
jgi:hypothetical protein